MPAVQGKVIVLFNCRGGAGATSLAVNTAHALVRMGKSACIVDLDMQLGDVFVALDLKPETSIAALAREASTIDSAALRRRLARHDSGIYALTQIGHIDDIDPALVERIPALISTLTDHFDYVLIDGVRDFGDYALSVLDMADVIGMVLAQDVSSVRRAGRAITLFRRLGYSDHKLKVVLNRWTRKAQVSNDEIARALRLSVSAKVRNDFKRIHTALNEGALLANLAPGSGVAKDFAHLAVVLGGLDGRAENTAQVSKLPSWLGFLRRGGK
jgi:pilus assembly protein CpaE